MSNIISRPTYITPSLYSAWHFWDSASDDYKEKALSDFLCVLTKTKNPPTKAMQNGLDYEQKIQAMAERVRLGIPFDENDTMPEVDKTIARLLQNCIWQFPVSGCITLQNGTQIILNGRVDAFDPIIDTIYDLKLTSRTFSQGMYQSSIQHLIYMYCLNVPYFNYVIRNKSNVLLLDNYANLPVEELLKSRIEHFINTLQITYPEYFNIYQEKWQTNI